MQQRSPSSPAIRGEEKSASVHVIVFFPVEYRPCVFLHHTGIHCFTKKDEPWIQMGGGGSVRRTLRRPMYFPEIWSVGLQSISNIHAWEIHVRKLIIILYPDHTPPSVKKSRILSRRPRWVGYTGSFRQNGEDTFEPKVSRVFALVKKPRSKRLSKLFAYKTERNEKMTEQFGSAARWSRVWERRGESGARKDSEPDRVSLRGLGLHLAVNAREKCLPATLPALANVVSFVNRYKKTRI